MVSTTEDKKLVVVQLSGGNDYLNTVVPYASGDYYDFRGSIKIDPEDVIPIDDEIGLRPGLNSIKRLWDQGKVAIIHGIGYANPNRSHFRSMDILSLIHISEPTRPY